VVGSVRAAAKLQLADRTQAAIFGLQQRVVPLDEALNDDQVVDAE
jgi:hypothetical protein